MRWIRMEANTILTRLHWLLTLIVLFVFRTTARDWRTHCITASSVLAGETTTITCHFYKNVSQSIIAVDRFGADQKQVTVVQCYPSATYNFQCQNERGYNFKMSAGNTFSMALVDVTRAFAGRYGCQLVSEKNSVETCVLDVKDGVPQENAEADKLIDDNSMQAGETVTPQSSSSTTGCSESIDITATETALNKTIAIGVAVSIALVVMVLVVVAVLKRKKIRQFFRGYLEKRTKDVKATAVENGHDKIRSADSEEVVKLMK